MNPLLGGCFSLVYGAAVAADAIGSGAVLAARPRAHASRRVPVVLAVRGDGRARSWTAPARRSRSASSASRAHSPVVTLAALARANPRPRARRTPPRAECRVAACLDRRRRHHARPVPALLRSHLRSVLGGIPRRPDSARLDPDPARTDLRLDAARASAAMLAAVILAIGASDHDRRYLERAGHRQPP